MENKIAKYLNKISLMNSDENLSRSYMIEAENTLLEMTKQDEKWKLIMGYYACYYAICSIYAKCGIKVSSENSAVELMKHIIFQEKDHYMMYILKQDKEQTQYYLKERVLENENQIRDFIKNCIDFNSQLNQTKINEYRGKIEDLKNGYT